MPGGVQFNPVGSILPPCFGAGDGDFNLADSAGLEPLGHGLQNPKLIRHVFKAVIEGDEVERGFLQVG